MILPVIAFGHPILKKKAEDIELNQANISSLVSDMFETMYHCNGVGLAAPQIGQSLRVFVIDSSKLSDDDERRKKDEKGTKEVFINPIVKEEFGDLVSYEEGCLSIPSIYGNVDRPGSIKIEYYDAKLSRQEKTFTGFTARVIQHEFDHIEGVLFIEHLKPIKKQLIKRKLDDLKKGIVKVRYKMKFV